MTSRRNDGIKRKPYGLAIKRDLRELAAGVSPLQDPLDLVHVTSVGLGRIIIETGKIEARPCKIFGRDLAYAFVARPAFKLRNGEDKSDQINRFPMAFVLSPRNLVNPYHVYPFDTGAAVEGRYGDAVDPYVYLEDYELDPNLIAAQHHISWAFDTNRAYFDGDIRPDLTKGMPAWQSVGRGYSQIAGLAASGSNRPDKRASAIEVAYSAHIPIKDNVCLVVLPEQLVEDGGAINAPFVAELNERSLKWETYDWRPNETPDSFIDQITRVVRRHLEQAGQL